MIDDFVGVSGPGWESPCSLPPLSESWLLLLLPSRASVGAGSQERRGSRLSERPSCPVAWESDPPSGEPFSAHFLGFPDKVLESSSNALVDLCRSGDAFVTYFLVPIGGPLVGMVFGRGYGDFGSKTLTPWADRASHIIGTFAVSIMTLATLLQLHKTVRTASIESFSMWSIILFAVADSLWLTNSLVRGNHSLTVEKVLAVIVGVALVIAGTSRKQVAKEREPKLVCRA